MPQEVLLWLGIASLVAIGLLLWGFAGLKRKRLIENVPTSKVKGVFIGLNEVKGVIRTTDPLTSFLAELPCVYYRYTVEEHYRYTETYTDSKGNTKTRTVSGWRTLDTGGEMIPFQLEDDTGTLRVVPDGAEIEPKSVMAMDCGRLDPLYYAKGPASSISNSTHERRFSEQALAVGDTIYVMGMAAFNEARSKPEIRASRQAEMFLISVRDEKAIVSRYGWTTYLKLFFGTLFAGAAPIAFGLPDANSVGEALRHEIWGVAQAAAIYLGIVGLYYFLLVYNGLVSVRERFEMAQSMVDVQLRRRAILIPQLVTCVKAYAGHESESHERVARMRTGQAQRVLIGLVEEYPDLKADKNFSRLHDELVNSEDKVALAREFYNGTVRAYNDRILAMPDVLVARLTGFRKRDYL